MDFSWQCHSLPADVIVVHLAVFFSHPLDERPNERLLAHMTVIIKINDNGKQQQQMKQNKGRMCLMSLWVLLFSRRVHNDRLGAVFLIHTCVHMSAFNKKK